MKSLLSVRDWNKRYENNRTREMKRMDWVPVPNRMDGRGYCRLMDHPNAAAHLGAWLAIIEIASRCTPRGTLSQEGAGIPQEGAGLCDEDLSRMSRIPVEVFREAIPRLIEIGWLDQQVLSNPKDRTIPQEGAGIPQEGAPRARSVPFPSLPFRSGGAGGEMAWKLDPGFADFVELATACWSALIDSDFEDAYPAWGALSLLDRIRAVKWIRDASEAGQDFKFVPRPLKFLERREFERKIEPQKKPSKSFVNELLEEYAREEKQNAG